MLKGKKILLGVTGSIAAYKAALLVRLLIKEGAEVRVVTTPAANKFVTDLTFSNLTQQEVFSDLWGGTWTEHVHLGQWPDLFLIAPATANTISKLANGIADNALTAVYLSARCPVMLAPAMDSDMIQHAATQENLDKLFELGVEVLPTEEGFLASGLTGPGRMLEPEVILKSVENFFSPKPLEGKKVLVTAGPTREYIDPVRFISNPSTGKMGYSLAAAAKKAGATVTLISGPVDGSLKAPVAPVHVETASQMFDAVMEHLTTTDILIMTAAVGDYQPIQYSSEKIKKGASNLMLELGRTKDILAEAGRRKKKGQIFLGFALESENEILHGREKLKSKNLDYIVVNSVKEEGAGFGLSTNAVTLLDINGGEIRFPLSSKTKIADEILQKIIHDGGYKA